MFAVLLAAAALVLSGFLIAWALNPPPGRHTTEHLSTQPLVVVPDRVVEIGEWR